MDDQLQEKQVCRPTSQDHPAVNVAVVGGPLVEGDPASSATLSLTLSNPPVSGCASVTLQPDSQLVHDSFSTIIFCSSPVHLTQITDPEKAVLLWNSTVNISVFAIDDSIREGSHAGNIFFPVNSDSADYASLPVSPVSIEIVDNDCYRIFPKNGITKNCSSSHGSNCTLQCDMGYEDSQSTVLMCLDSVWHPPPPTCFSCSEGYYASGSRCLPCSTGSCQVRAHAFCRNVTNPAIEFPPNDSDFPCRLATIEGNALPPEMLLVFSVTIPGPPIQSMSLVANRHTKTTAPGRVSPTTLMSSAATPPSVARPRLRALSSQI